MKVYALVGRSGTGKSHRALFVAQRYNIDYIVDDGLFIKKNKKIAGESAKREQTYISAVKRAIFYHEAHCQEVIKQIARHQPKRLLVLGTSDKMVMKIIKRLGIKAIYETIYIEDVSSPKELAIAKEMRKKHGKHVVPVPAVELKGDFSGYFLDKLKLLNFQFGKRTEVVEKTVVRPTFSYLGKYTISNKALMQIVEHSLLHSMAIKQVFKIKFYNEKQGIKIDVDICARLGAILHEELKKVMGRMHVDLEIMTQLNVIALKINVKSIK